MSSTNAGDKPRNKITITLKFLHEARLIISYQFDGNRNAGGVSLKLSCNEITQSHGNEFTVRHVFLLAADQLVYRLKPLQGRTIRKVMGGGGGGGGRGIFSSHDCFFSPSACAGIFFAGETLRTNFFFFFRQILLCLSFTN